MPQATVQLPRGAVSFRKCTNNITELHRILYEDSLTWIEVQFDTVDMPFNSPAKRMSLSSFSNLMLTNCRGTH